MEEGAVHRHEALAADDQASVPRQPGECALHHSAMASQPVLRFDPLPRDPMLDPALDAGVAAAAVVVPLIGVQLIGTTAGAPASAGPDRNYGVEQWLEHAALVHVCRRHRGSEREALAVDEEMVLAAGPPLVGRVRDDVAPPFRGQAPAVQARPRPLDLVRRREPLQPALAQRPPHPPSVTSGFMPACFPGRTLRLSNS